MNGGGGACHVESTGDDRRKDEGRRGDRLDERGGGIRAVGAAIVDGAHFVLLDNAEAHHNARRNSGSWMGGVERGEGLLHGFCGCKRADDDTFGTFLGGRRCDGSGGDEDVGAGPPAESEAAVGIAVPRGNRGEECLVGNIGRERRAGRDWAVNTAIRNGTDDWKTLHEALNQGDVEPVYGVDGNRQESRVYSRGDTGYGRRHEGVDCERDGTEGDGGAAEGGESSDPIGDNSVGVGGGVRNGTLSVGRES